MSNWSDWIDYLDTLDEADRLSFDGCCGCYNCNRIRDGFAAYEASLPKETEAQNESN